MKGFSRVDMDAVAPLSPANKTAALVSGKGEHFDWKPRDVDVHTDTPIQLRQATKKEYNDPNYVDLKGASVGRLKVMGIAAFSSQEKKRWVVRCVCGSYEVRRSKYVKHSLKHGVDEAGREPMCMWCRKTQLLQNGIGIKRDKPLIDINSAE